MVYFIYKEKHGFLCRQSSTLSTENAKTPFTYLTYTKQQVERLAVLLCAGFDSRITEFFQAGKVFNPLISIPQVMWQEDLDFSADSISIAAPVYGHEMPFMVRQRYCFLSPYG